jgi:hypothetical protein
LPSVSVVVVASTVPPPSSSSTGTPASGLSAPFCTPLLFWSRKTRPEIDDGMISAKLLLAEPLVSPPAPSVLSTMPVIWLVPGVGLMAVPGVPVLPLIGLSGPALLVPFTVPAGATGSHTE